MANTLKHIYYMKHVHISKEEQQVARRVWTQFNSEISCADIEHKGFLFMAMGKSGYTRCLLAFEKRAIAVR